jgi:hypothetical protein
MACPFIVIVLIAAQAQYNLHVAARRDNRPRRFIFA